ncbi:gliding motility-associated ABC transporter permease subunit GldF [Sediminicola luteus]|uniref:Gliding motility-associated ABC transporter permease subunit GldF n=1 Tax=Sediminicola luteus TaxID=319238 RepID=A0A2A4G1V7_9FLAO|nr:gliding motility-associated ABC transporter permease subunit GldF [Sediminicola luteus]PCE62667.1 gliding motility-associated ABC transporter permease subunit GldF [Sediminicola luteus]
MLALFKKELRAYFASPIAYLVMGLLLVLTGLFLWVFKGPFNILDSGFAELSSFFLLVPWIFLLIVPALGMRSFAEERKMGTLELLFIKPLSHLQIVLGKFLAIVVLVLIALLPTLLYSYTIGQLGMETNNFDSGVVMGSYFGLVFLLATYAAISLFTSSLTQNQVVAFILGMLLSFCCFYGFEALSTLISDGSSALNLAQWGMKARFENIARGILDIRDLIYFVALCAFFLFLTVGQLKKLNR